LSKEQKQLKRLRRRKRELEAMVSTLTTGATLLRPANAVLPCAVYTDSAWDA
jgi:cell division protein FtsB